MLFRIFCHIWMCMQTMLNISSTEVSMKKKVQVSESFFLLCSVWCMMGEDILGDLRLSWLWLGWLKNCMASKREKQKQLVSVSEWPDKQHQVPFKVNKDYVKLWIIQTYFLIAICFTWDSSPSNLCDSLLLDSTSCCCGLGPLSTVSQHFIKAVWQSALLQLSMVHLCVTILQLWLETD